MKKHTVIFTAIIFIFILFGCGGEEPQEIMDRADKSIQSNNIAEAVNAYEELFDEHPDSELAPQALYKLAMLYQSKLVKNLEERESLNKALALLKRIYDNYPDSPKAPQALFMMGFIYANDLQNLSKAKEIYEKFINEYPDNELAGSAKEEMANLGLSPEEILEKKLNNSKDE